jgi:hypothetical protein
MYYKVLGQGQTIAAIARLELASHVKLMILSTITQYAFVNSLPCTLKVSHTQCLITAHTGLADADESFHLAPLGPDKASPRCHQTLVWGA